MNDTSRAVEAKYREMLMCLSPQRRFYLAAGMFSDARALVLASLQNQTPPGRNCCRSKPYRRMASPLIALISFLRPPLLTKANQ